MTTTEETITTRRKRQHAIHVLLEVLDAAGIDYGQATYTQDREARVPDTVRDYRAGKVEHFDILTPVDLVLSTYYAASGNEDIEAATSRLVRFLFKGEEHVVINGTGRNMTVRFFGVHGGLAIMVIPGGGTFVGEVVTGEEVVPKVECSYKGLTPA